VKDATYDRSLFFDNLELAPTIQLLRAVSETAAAGMKTLQCQAL
jgi:hypothetical protein